MGGDVLRKRHLSFVKSNGQTCPCYPLVNSKTVIVDGKRDFLVGERQPPAAQACRTYLYLVGARLWYKHKLQMRVPVRVQLLGLRLYTSRRSMGSSCCIRRASCHLQSVYSLFRHLMRLRDGVKWLKLRKLRRLCFDLWRRRYTLKTRVKSIF